MSQIKFEIIGIPVAKGRPRFSVASGFALALQYLPGEPIDTAISVDLVFYMPIPTSMSKKQKILAETEQFPMIKRPDLDNLIKASIDPLNGVFWTDDSRITEKKARKVYSKNPRTKYIITY